jgi:hypothetical protein
MKLILGFLTYPRDNTHITFELLQNTFHSLVKKQNVQSIDIKIIVVGDDYPKIEELRPIFDGFDVSLYSINTKDALRNTDLHPEFIWCYAPVRSVIYLHEKTLELSDSYDYLLLSADDEKYFDGKLQSTLEYAKKYNNPDLIYTLARYGETIILPRSFNSSKLLENYPRPGDVIASGIYYNLKNKDFILDIIEFRKKQWEYLQSCIREKKANYPEMYVISKLYPEDAQLWDYLTDKFIKKTYTSLLIPTILIHHFSERTVFKYIKTS